MIAREQVIAIDLSIDERSFIACALNEWNGATRCTDELARALEFASPEAWRQEAGVRLWDAIHSGAPLRAIDWLHVLMATELAFGSYVWGNPLDWTVVSGLSEEQSIVLLRRVQRKIGPRITLLVGAGFNTLGRAADDDLA